jgi:hypothetical protein
MNWAVCTPRRVRDIASSSKGKEELAALGVRVIALTALLPEDAREEIEAILIESVKTLRDEESQLETLGKMLPYISDSRRKEMAVAIFKKRSTMRGPERGTVFLNALACLPPDEPAIPPLTGAHLALLAYVDSQQISCGVCRLNVSGAAAACVNGLRFEAAVDEVTNIAFDWTLARAMRLLVARRLPMLDEPAAAAGWRKMLEKANRLPRWRFFTCVAEMVPLVARFWGPQELSLTWRAIAEIGTRWP